MDGIDHDRLHEFVGRMLGDLGAATSVALIRLGDRLGLYRLLHEGGPATPAELAERAQIDERYAREWLRAQAASGYLVMDAAEDRFELPPEHAMVFAVEDSPVNLMGGFDLSVRMLESEAAVEQAFRSGGGVDWGEQGCIFCAVGRFFRPGYINNLVQSWIPALDGVEDKLRAGAKVADVGCGVGHSTLIMARAYPDSEFVGYDFHDGSIEEANRHAANHGLADRVRFEVARAQAVPETGFDLITCFDCLHDMGDPAGAARSIRGALKPDGTWMIVEPLAGDTPADNMNPVGRLYYNASTMICVPTSKAQEVSTALGAQAGQARLTEVIRSGGFNSVRRATEGPFNMILEATL
ncbi:MAG: class I SAM-dependent methyltransferase [Planctomycetota bacterium]